MPLPHPVVVVPGITGSNLRDAYQVSPETVWSTLLHKDHERRALHPDDLRYELQEPARVVADSVFGIPYGSLIDELRHNLSERSDRPVPVYPFPYDWRQPLDLIEMQLEAFIKEVIARTRLMRHYESAGFGDKPRVNLVGHSMGGLIVAGYLQRLGKKAQVDKVVTLGAPFRGSLEAPIKVITGTASIGPDAGNDSREREAARLTPALYHLLPSFDGSVVSDPGLPDDLYDVGTWQTGVVETLAEFIRLHGVDAARGKAARRVQAREVLSGMLKLARTHRNRLEALRLGRTSVGSAANWLCLVGVDSTTRVSLRVTVNDKTPFFDLSSANRLNQWDHPNATVRMTTGDGTVPFLGAESAFLKRKHLVCLRPDDFGYWELKDKALLKVTSFHSLLPSLNLAQRLIVSHLRGTPTKGIWGRPAPGISQATWEPPIRGLELKE